MSPFRRLVAGLPRAFWILFAGTVVNRTGSFVLPFLAVYLTRVRHFSLAQAGAVAALWGVGVAIAGPLGGFIADRIGRRATMMFALLVGGAGMIGLGFLHSIAWIAPATMLVALIGEMYRPAMLAAIVDVVPARDRVRAMGLIYWAINLGVAIGASLGGLLATVSYTLLFVGDGLTTLAFGFIVWRAVTESHTPVERAASGAGGHLRDFFIAFHDPPFVGFFVLIMLIAAIFMQHTSTLPLDMAAHGLSSAAIGLVLAVNGGLIVLVQPFLGPWLSHRNPSRVMAAGSALVGVGFGLNALARGTPSFGVAAIVWTIGEIFVLPIANSVVADLSPPESRGRYSGATGLSWGLAAATGPLLGTFVLQHLGACMLWGGCLALGITVGLAHLAWAPALTRIRTERLARAHGGAMVTPGR
jgi:predicted MFS family arabinose efflux permease